MTQAGLVDSSGHLNAEQGPGEKGNLELSYQVLNPESQEPLQGGQQIDLLVVLPWPGYSALP